MAATSCSWRSRAARDWRSSSIRLHSPTRSEDWRQLPGGGEVWGLAVDPEEALLEYLELFYNLRRAGGVLRRMGAVEFVTTIAPGLRDVLLTGKAVELVRRRDKKHARAYDAIVLDAPPTGRITRFLNVNTEIAGVAKVGPIRNQADGVMAILRSDKTAVHLTTLLEEMPVQETADGVAELEDAALPVGGIVVNMTRPQVLDTVAASGLTVPELAGALSRAGIDATPRIVEALRAEGGRSRGPHCPRDHGAGAHRRPGQARLRPAIPRGRHRPRGPLRTLGHAARAGDGLMGSVPALDTDVLLRGWRYPHHRVLRLRRRRQDDDRSCAPACGRPKWAVACAC